MPTQLTDFKATVGLAYASGTADRTGATLDMSGFQSVLIAVTVAGVATGATYSVKAQSDADSAFGSAQDITGTSQTIADDHDGQTFLIWIQNPPERYVRVYVDKDTSNACGEAVMYYQFDPDKKPQTADTANAVTTESFVWPAVGTA